MPTSLGIHVSFTMIIVVPAEFYAHLSPPHVVQDTHDRQHISIYLILLCTGASFLISQFTGYTGDSKLLSGVSVAS
jgi:hypothetical protein